MHGNEYTVARGRTEADGRAGVSKVMRAVTMVMRAADGSRSNTAANRDIFSIISQETFFKVKN